jgi:sodium-coupled neutral amino acid transporter 9
MVHLDLDTYEYAAKVDQIVGDITLNEEEKTSRLDASKTERLSKKRSSYATIFNIANTLMGSALLVMPVSFYGAGMLSSVIGAIVMAIISFYTADLYLIHSRRDEIDYPEAILRILGKKWCFLYNFISMLLLYLVGLIHFILMSQSFYAILKNLAPDSSDWGGSKDIVFNNFSMQWVGVIMFALCAVLFSLKDLRHILWFNDKGVYMILIFCIFIIYLGLDVLISTDIFVEITKPDTFQNQGGEIVLFTADIETLVGIFALAFFIHNVHTGVLKSNRNPKNNTRDLGIAYSLVFFFYCILGIFGMIAVAGLYHADYANNPKLLGSIMEYLVKTNPYLTTTKYILACIALFMIWTQLTTVIPILCYFCRRQFFALFYGENRKIPNLYFHIFNVGFNVLCLVIEILAIDISKIIGFTGAFAGFFLIYMIPVCVHLKCLYFRKSQIEGGLLKDQENAEEKQYKRKDPNRCVNHDDYKLGNPIFVYTFYIVLSLFGLGILGAQVYDLFK